MHSPIILELVQNSQVDYNIQHIINQKSCINSELLNNDNIRNICNTWITTLNAENINYIAVPEFLWKIMENQEQISNLWNSLHRLNERTQQLLSLIKHLDYMYGNLIVFKNKLLSLDPIILQEAFNTYKFKCNISEYFSLISFQWSHIVRIFKIYCQIKYKGVNHNSWLEQFFHENKLEVKKIVLENTNPNFLGIEGMDTRFLAEISQTMSINRESKILPQVLDNCRSMYRDYFDTYVEQFYAKPRRSLKLLCDIDTFKEGFEKLYRSYFAEKSVNNNLSFETATKLHLCEYFNKPLGIGENDILEKAYKLHSKKMIGAFTDTSNQLANKDVREILKLAHTSDKDFESYMKILENTKN